MQQALINLMEHKLVSTGAIKTSCDKQQSVSVRKLPLSDLPNGTRDFSTNPQGSSPLPKERGPFSDFLKISGIKRHPCDCPPSMHHLSSCNNSTNGHLVYARRRLEEAGKFTSDEMDRDASPKSRKISSGERKGLSLQQHQMQEASVSCSPAFSVIPATSATAFSQGISAPFALGMPMTQFPPLEPKFSIISSGIPAQANSPSSDRIYWKDRFLRLQMFLNSCDQANQEEYIQMLRSLSSVGRSKHAVELEKRAIHLLLEEGKELHRMKLLNVLGKIAPNHL